MNAKRITFIKLYGRLFRVPRRKLLRALSRSSRRPSCRSRGPSGAVLCVVFVLFMFLVVALKQGAYHRAKIRKLWVLHTFLFCELYFINVRVQSNNQAVAEMGCLLSRDTRGPTQLDLPLKNVDNPKSLPEPVMTESLLVPEDTNVTKIWDFIEQSDDPVMRKAMAIFGITQVLVELEMSPEDTAAFAHKMLELSCKDTQEHFAVLSGFHDKKAYDVLRAYVRILLP